MSLGTCTVHFQETLVQWDQSADDVDVNVNVRLWGGMQKAISLRPTPIMGLSTTSLGNMSTYIWMYYIAACVCPTDILLLESPCSLVPGTSVQISIEELCQNIGFWISTAIQGQDYVLNFWMFGVRKNLPAVQLETLFHTNTTSHMNIEIYQKLTHSPFDSSTLLALIHATEESVF